MVIYLFIFKGGWISLNSSSALMNFRQISMTSQYCTTAKVWFETKIEKWVMKPMNVMIGIAMTLIVLNWQRRLNPRQGFESQLQKRSCLTGTYRQRPYTWEERENNILGNYNGWSHEVWIYEGRPVMMRRYCRSPLCPLLTDGFTVSLLSLINKTHTVCRCRRNGVEKMRGD